MEFKIGKWEYKKQFKIKLDIGLTNKSVLLVTQGNLIISPNHWGKKCKSSCKTDLSVIPLMRGDIDWGNLHIGDGVNM